MSALDEVNKENVAPGEEQKVQTEAEPKKFKILFAGRDEFSCLVLKQLHRTSSVWSEIHVLTQPDMMVGRDKKELSVSPLKNLAHELKLPVIPMPKDKVSFRKWTPPAPFALEESATPPDDQILITASFGRVISLPFLSHFLPSRRLNVHPSLLPTYRGPSPIQYAIIDQLPESGVCVISMNEFKKGIDTGDIWGVEKVGLGKSEKLSKKQEGPMFEEVRDRMGKAGAGLLTKVLKEMKAGTATCVPQADATNARHAPAITLEDSYIDFKTMTAADIEARFRAYGHQRPLTTTVPTPTGPRRLQLIHIIVFPPLPAHYPPVALSLTPGACTMNRSFSKFMLVRCVDGAILRVRRVKMEGKENLWAEEWWHGLASMWGWKGSKGAEVTFGAVSPAELEEYKGATEDRMAGRKKVSKKALKKERKNEMRREEWEEAAVKRGEDAAVKRGVDASWREKEEARAVFVQSGKGNREEGGMRDSWRSGANS